MPLKLHVEGTETVLRLATGSTGRFGKKLRDITVLHKKGKAKLNTK